MPLSPGQCCSGCQAGTCCWGSHPPGTGGTEHGRFLQRPVCLGDCTGLAQEGGLARQLGREKYHGTTSPGTSYGTAFPSNQECLTELKETSKVNFFPKILLKNLQYYRICAANTLGLHSFTLLRADVPAPSLFLIKHRFVPSFIFYGHLIHVDPDSSALQSPMQLLCSHVASTPCSYCSQLKGTSSAADSPALNAQPLRIPSKAVMGWVLVNTNTSALMAVTEITPSP